MQRLSRLLTLKKVSQSMHQTQGGIDITVQSEPQSSGVALQVDLR